MSDALVTGRVSGEEAVARVFVQVRELGVGRDRIEVLTDVPLPEGVLGGEMADTRLPWFTGIGLMGGFALGLFFSLGTVLLYPLVVGGQGLISPPVFIIVYELTMAGIVVMTVAGLIYENRVKGDPIRDQRINPVPGEAVIVVRVPREIIPGRIEDGLREAGAEEVWSTHSGERSRPGGRQAGSVGEGAGSAGGRT